MQDRNKQGNFQASGYLCRLIRLGSNSNVKETFTTLNLKFVREFCYFRVSYSIYESFHVFDESYRLCY